MRPRLALRRGALYTLAYFENGHSTSRAPTVTNDTQAAAVALLVNYMAASFIKAADGHGGTLIAEAAQTANQLVPLTTPHQ